MARTPAELDRPAGELAPQPQGGATTLDRNDFYAPAGLPPAPRAPMRPPNPLRGLILPLIVAIVCGTGAFIVSNYFMTRWYTSSVTILFPSSGNQGGMLNAFLGGGTSGPTSIPLIGPYSTPQYSNDVGSAITVLDSGRAKAEVMNRLQLPQRWHLTPDEAGARFNKNVSYGVDKNQSLVLQANDTDPRLAQRIVNAYMQALRDVSTELNTTRAHQNVVALRQRYATAQASLARDEDEQVALQRRMAQTMPLGSAVTGSYADLVNQQTAAQTELGATNAEIKAQLQTAQKTYGNGLNLPTSVAFSNSTIQDLHKAEANFNRISAEYAPGYPGYREAKEQLDQAREDAKAELQRQYSAANKFITPDMAGLYVKQRSLQARLDNLNQAAQDRKAVMLSLPDAQRHEADLTRRITQANGVDATLAQALTQAELTEKRDVPTFMVMDAAGIPAKPSLPRVGYTTALAAIAGFVLTIAWLAARAMWKQPASQEQLRRWTDAYGLTEQGGAPQALAAGTSPPLPERSAPRLPYIHDASVASPEETAPETEDAAGNHS